MTFEQQAECGKIVGELAWMAVREFAKCENCPDCIRLRRIIGEAFLPPFAAMWEALGSMSSVTPQTQAENRELARAVLSVPESILPSQLRDLAEAQLK
jgi:hypothetical protein